MNAHAQTCRNSVVFTSVSSCSSTLKCGTVEQPWSVLESMYDISVRKPMCLACILNKNVWLILMDSVATNSIAGKVLILMLTCDYSSVMKSSACMCKTMINLFIWSARVQHFSAFIFLVILENLVPCIIVSDCSILIDRVVSLIFYKCECHIYKSQMIWNVAINLEKNIPKAVIQSVHVVSMLL